MKPRIIIAPNSFKSSIDSFRICQIVEKELRENITEDCIIDTMPIGDGGDGTGYIIARNLGSIKKYYRTVDPLGRKRNSPIYISKHTAIIEMADVSGLRLLDPEDYSPRTASNEGLGKLISKLYLEGVTKLILCIGGSATIDMGLGVIKALGARFYDANDDEIFVLDMKNLKEIKRIDSSLLKRFHNLKIDILCDVENPLLGDNGAVRVYGPQKGVKDYDVELYVEQHAYMCSFLERMFDLSLANMKYGGAAGGLPIVFSCFFNVELFQGTSYILDLLDFDNKLIDCKLLISGEGCMDSQTSFGKAPYIIANLAGHSCDNIVAINGQTKSLPKVFTHSYSLSDYSSDLNEAINNPEPYLRKVAQSIAKLINDNNILS